MPLRRGPAAASLLKTEALALQKRMTEQHFAREENKSRGKLRRSAMMFAPTRDLLRI
jgi:hypothetical protein